VETHIDLRDSISCPLPPPVSPSKSKGHWTP
jgi:hypothetical protein